MSTPGTVDQIELLAKRKRVEILRRKIALAKKFGLLYYKPHDKQLQFIRAADFRFRLARCGNRFGKSDMGVSEDLAFAMGERVWFPKGHPLRTHGIPKTPQKGLIVAADWDKVEEIFTGDGARGHVGKIWKKIPKDLAIGTPKKTSGGVISSLRIKSLYGESVLDFDTRKSFDANPMGAESSDYDFVHIDEPIREAHWKAILRGLTDRGGKAWFTCTLIEQPWINDFFFPDLQSRRKEHYEQVDQETGRKIKWVMTGSIYDNPYLSPADIEDFLNTLSEDERQCRIHGIPLHLSGLVYKEFDYDKHILKEVPTGWKDFATPPKDYTIIVAVDPHPRTPHAVLFAAVSPHGQIFFYDEIFKAEAVYKLAEKIKDKTKGYFVWRKRMDPYAWVEHPIEKTTIAQEFDRCGLYGFQRASKDLDRGILVTKSYLGGQEDYEVYFSPLLRTTIWEISRYAWADKQGVPTNKPVDADDHMMENLRRILIERPYYVDPTYVAEPVEDEVIDVSYDFDEEEIPSLTAI